MKRSVFLVREEQRTAMAMGFSCESPARFGEGHGLDQLCGNFQRLTVGPTPCPPMSYPTMTAPAPSISRSLISRRVDEALQGVDTDNLEHMGLGETQEGHRAIRLLGRMAEERNPRAVESLRRIASGPVISNADLAHEYLRDLKGYHSRSAEVERGLEWVGRACSFCFEKIGNGIDFLGQACSFCCNKLRLR